MHPLGDLETESWLSGWQRAAPQLNQRQYDEPNVPPPALGAISVRVAEVAVWTPARSLQADQCQCVVLWLQASVLICQCFTGEGWQHHQWHGLPQVCDILFSAALLYTYFWFFSASFAGSGVVRCQESRHPVRSQFGRSLAPRAWMSQQVQWSQES